MRVIQAKYSGQIAEETLGHDEIKNLFGILSLICADNQPNPENFPALEASKKLEAVNWSLNLQIKEIQACPVDNKEKLQRIISLIKTILHSFNQTEPPQELKQTYKDLVVSLYDILA